MTFSGRTSVLSLYLSMSCCEMLHSCCFTSQTMWAFPWLMDSSLFNWNRRLCVVYRVPNMYQIFCQIFLQRWIWEVQAVLHGHPAALLLHMLFLCELQVCIRQVYYTPQLIHPCVSYRGFTLCILLCAVQHFCFYPKFRFLDAILNFLLVWYYCTLTIRESILITNGSK